MKLKVAQKIQELSTEKVEIQNYNGEKAITGITGMEVMRILIKNSSEFRKIEKSLDLDYDFQESKLKGKTIIY